MSELTAEVLLLSMVDNSVSSPNRLTRHHNVCCVMMYNEKTLNPVQT
jgi:hypothetical protein